jgi:hypothetical protein
MKESAPIQSHFFRILVSDTEPKTELMEGCMKDTLDLDRFPLTYD